MAAGGWPIRVNGITIGGLGVSGGNAIGRDDDIAGAGLAVLGAIAQAAMQAQPVQPPQAQYPPPWAQPPIPGSYQGAVPQPVPPHQAVEPPVSNANRAATFPDASGVNAVPQVQQTTNTIHLPENDPYEAFHNTTSTAPHTGLSGDQA